MLKALVSILPSGSQLEMRGETYVVFSTVSVTQTNTFNILKCPNTISQDWWVLIQWPYTENWAKSAWWVVALTFHDTTVYINISNCSLTKTNFSSIALSTFSTTPSVVTLGCLCVVTAGCKEWYDPKNSKLELGLEFSHMMQAYIYVCRNTTSACLVNLQEVLPTALFLPSFDQGECPPWHPSSWSLQPSEAAMSSCL